MKLSFTLEGYLKRLRAMQDERPDGERLEVPSVEELAESVGIRRQTLYHMMAPQAKMINRETVGGIVEALRDAGHDPQLTDLLSLENGSAGES